MSGKLILLYVVVAVLVTVVWFGSKARDVQPGEVSGEVVGNVAREIDVIPVPKSVNLTTGVIDIAKDATVRTSREDGELGQVINLFQETVFAYTGVLLDESEANAAIVFELDTSIDSDEAYIIEITSAGAAVRASAPAGHFYGAMTLAQMLDSGELGRLAALPLGIIEDEPRLKWRGAMLDVARHFRTKEFVLKFLDWMAVHKLNVFHWHLTDDQAWRLEIKKYPKLTEVGAWRVPAGDASDADIDPETGKPRLYGGYYTQEDVREIVAYAEARFITVLPEIGLPGHATAAVAAYPEFGTADPFAGDLSDWGIFENTYNLQPETLKFLEDVMEEVLVLFPGDFVHIGGDEVATNQWAASSRTKSRMIELDLGDVHDIQSYFTKHFATFLSDRGRRLIGWDEILESGSIENSAIMSWRGTKGGVAAAKMGRQVVMAPSSIYYTDYRQSDSRHEPTGREHIQILKDVYEFEPVSNELTAEEKTAVLGAEMTIFSEHMRTEERVEHMAFPRLVAMAETVWSPPSAKSFNGFVKRLMPHMRRLKSLGLRPADSAFEVRFSVAIAADVGRVVSLENQVGQGDILYTLNGSAPTESSTLYQGPFEAHAGQTVKAATFHGRQPLSATRSQPLDRRTLSERTSDELALCSNQLAIKLDDDAPREGPRAGLMVDIMKPCWIYENPDMTDVAGIEVEVGNLPYNFQIGDLIEKVQLLKPETKDGELVMFENSCETGKEIGRLPFQPAVKNFATTKLKAALPQVTDATALCFQVAAHHYDPLWAIDRVRLIGK